MIMELHEASSSALDQLYDRYWSARGYMEMLTEKDNTENQARAENVCELKSI